MRRRAPRPRAVPFLLALAALTGCSGTESERAEPAGAPSANASPAEQARAIAGDPRMLLFDLQTALEGAREARGGYPSSSEFRLEDRWSLQRAALDAAFTTWSYESDGASYRLAGETGDKRLEIRGPS